MEKAIEVFDKLSVSESAADNNNVTSDLPPELANQIPSYLAQLQAPEETDGKVLDAIAFFYHIADQDFAVPVETASNNKGHGKKSKKNAVNNDINNIFMRNNELKSALTAILGLLKAESRPETQLAALNFAKRICRSSGSHCSFVAAIMTPLLTSSNQDLALGCLKALIDIDFNLYYEVDGGAVYRALCNLLKTADPSSQIAVSACQLMAKLSTKAHYDFQSVYVVEIVSCVGRVLKQSEDPDLLVSACKVLSELSERDHYDFGSTWGKLANRLVELTSREDMPYNALALRAVGNLATGDDVVTESVVKAGALAMLRNLALSKSAKMRKEALWIVSNICAGTPSQVKSVVDSGALDEIFIGLGDENAKVRNEARWAVSNISSGGYPEEIRKMAYTTAPLYLMNEWAKTSKLRDKNLCRECIYNIAKKVLSKHGGVYMDEEEEDEEEDHEVGFDENGFGVNAVNEVGMGSMRLLSLNKIWSVLSLIYCMNQRHLQEALLVAGEDLFSYIGFYSSLPEDEHGSEEDVEGNNSD